MSLPLTRTPYDAELGEITEQDREYANDLLSDLQERPRPAPSVEIVAQWLRKVRYEAVIEDRKKRPI